MGSLAERPGIYRLVYYLCPSKKGCEEYEAVSFSSRVSNSWKMDERDFIVSITTDKSGINLSEEKSDEIKVRIENDSEDESIFFNRALPIGYQRLVNGDWVTAGQISFDQSEFAGVYEVKPGSDFGPETLSLKGIVLQPGTYRFIYPFCSLGSACKREDQFLPVHLRVSNTVNVTQSDYQTEIFTDQTVVSLSEDDKIGVGIANNSDQAIFLNKSYYVGYQRYENGEWVTGELSWFTVDSFDDFYKIAPGEKHGGRGGNPFEFLPLKRLGNQTGAYRFIYQACRTNAECTEGDELPLALRVSNTWKVVE